MEIWLFLLRNGHDLACDMYFLNRSAAGVASSPHCFPRWVSGGIQKIYFID